MKIICLLVVLLALPYCAFPQKSLTPNLDPRFIENGEELPSKTYADQPYVTVCDDGSWLCTMTTSSGIEGAHMNHIVSTKSYDKGKNWTKLVYLEPPGIPQSSWAVPLKVPGGRIYVFYNYNQSRLKGLDGVMSGPFRYRYSDDHGKSWSEKAYEVPIRSTQIDRDNYTQGKNQFFWSIDKPVVTENGAYITFSKILRDSVDQPTFYSRSEGFILKSENILKENDPEKLIWKTLPDGETGIINREFGTVQAEHNMVMMNNGSLYVVYRTIDGFPVYAISNDDGKSFSTPQVMRYANGEPIGNTRACPKIHKTKDGKFLFWYHNNFNKNTYFGRNPAWLSGGLEVDGNIQWSQPEIAIYSLDPEIMGMSYPDFIEQDGQLWISETQKNIARTHKINLDLVQGLWDQGKDSILVEEGLIMESNHNMIQSGEINFPVLPELNEWGGFTIELWLTLDDLQPGQNILSTVGPKGRGIEVSLDDDSTIKISLNDGEVRQTDIKGNTEFNSDKFTMLPNNLHHVVFTLDGAAKVATVMVDGVLSDGSLDSRTHGWGRIYQHLTSLNDQFKCNFNQSLKGKVELMRVYSRALRNSEAIANFKFGSKN